MSTCLRMDNLLVLALELLEGVKNKQSLAQIILNTFHPLIYMFQLLGCARGSVELLGNKLIHMWQLLGCPSGSAELLGNKYVPAVVFKLTSKLPTNSLKA